MEQKTENHAGLYLNYDGSFTKKPKDDGPKYSNTLHLQLICMVQTKDTYVFLSTKPLNGEHIPTDENTNLIFEKGCCRARIYYPDAGGFVSLITAQQEKAKILENNKVKIGEVRFITADVAEIKKVQKSESYVGKFLCIGSHAGYCIAETEDTVTVCKTVASSVKSWDEAQKIAQADYDGKSYLPSRSELLVAVDKFPAFFKSLGNHCLWSSTERDSARAWHVSLNKLNFGNIDHLNKCYRDCNVLPFAVFPKDDVTAIFTDVYEKPSRRNQD